VPQVTEHAFQLYYFTVHQDSASNWISSSTGIALYLADYTWQCHTINDPADTIQPTVRALYNKGEVASVHSIKAYGRSTGIAGPFLTSTPHACKQSATYHGPFTVREGAPFTNRTQGSESIAGFDTLEHRKISPPLQESNHNSLVTQQIV
jgi:hypothetical protein